MDRFQESAHAIEKSTGLKEKNLLRPKVTVIVPVYNTGKYLAKCLDSITRQTLENIEIICINDGSSDNSQAILDHYAASDLRVKVITQENRGLSYARNIGMENAEGDYIGFVDSDDWIDLDFYEKLYKTALSCDAEMAAGCITIVEEGTKIPFLKYESTVVYRTTKDKYLAASLPKRCYVWNRIYKRDAILKNKIHFENGRLFEDQEFSHMALHLLNRLATVPDAHYYYFRHKDSVLANLDTDGQNDYEMAKVKCVKYIIKNNINVNICDIYPYDEKIKIYCFGIMILKIKTWVHVKKFFLFNFIPFLCIKKIH